MITSRTLGLGLTTGAALIGLAAAHPARASTTATHDYNYSVNAPTPANFLGTGNGYIVFTFDPAGANPAPATVTGSNLTFVGNWQIDPNPFDSSTSGIASFNPFGPSVTLGNGTAQNYVSVAVTKWGDSFSFDLNYTDPPGTDPTDFSLTYQKTGQSDVSLLDISFDPSGQATLMNSASGVTITPQAGTPNLSAPVPEASTTVSFGLLLSLGLVGMTVAAKRKKTMSR